MPLSPQKTLVVSLPSAPLEDNITFYFEACRVRRWHNPDHVLCKSIRLYYLLKGRNPLKQHSNWMGKSQEYKQIMHLIFLPVKERELECQSNTLCCNSAP